MTWVSSIPKACAIRLTVARVTPLALSDSRYLSKNWEAGLGILGEVSVKKISLRYLLFDSGATLDFMGLFEKSDRGGDGRSSA
jgi:hypothetical protein